MSRRTCVTSEPGLVGAGFHPEFHALDPAVVETIRRPGVSGVSQDQERETETENDGKEIGY